MRAIQLTPAFHLQAYTKSNWMAHTPVGHDMLLFGKLVTSPALKQIPPTKLVYPPIFILVARRYEPGA